jgi:hypothetical protein
MQRILQDTLDAVDFTGQLTGCSAVYSRTHRMQRSLHDDTPDAAQSTGRHTGWCSLQDDTMDAAH